MTEQVRYGFSLLTDYDIFLFRQGQHGKLYDKLGSHVIDNQEMSGTHFAVWAPNAQGVSVIGDFDSWDHDAAPLHSRWDSSGIWEGFVPDLKAGAIYKYSIISKNGKSIEKGDPFAFKWEIPPKTASVVWNPDFAWHDSGWLERRSERNSLNSPMSIYEVHLGSWRRVPEEGNRSLSYNEIANYLPDYASDLGFTHVEFLPLMEHAFYGSWGYQTMGYFAPTSRYGSPQDLMHLIDELHNREIGVILDWVPSHFPSDEYGLALFDGTHLFEHEDPRKGFHPEWHTSIFNYGRNEVRAFLTSSALFWLDKFHADGLRVDGVASMLYLDYARKSGEWIPNEKGGRENLEAIAFLKQLNEAAYREHPDIHMIAEESTAWPMVSRPTYLGGLGFGFKWNMGWMHDTLDYFSEDPIYRKYHQNQLTFSLWYAFSENFVLPLSHDEVVYGKGSLLNKMPGDTWQKFANLRLLFGYQVLHPGKKLLFMGGEIAQWNEWYHEASLDWNLLDYEPHRGVQKFVRDLNHLYRSKPSLHELDCDASGFEWVDFNDANSSVISFLRKGTGSQTPSLVVCNFTPIPRHSYRLGVPVSGFWKEALNSDAREYGGSGQGNGDGCHAEPVPSHGRDFSISSTLPPLGIIVFTSS